jgi:hypothetical protein
MARTELFGSFDVHWPARQGELVRRPPAEAHPFVVTRTLVFFAIQGVEKMPDGCESAFSPYVAPRMANVSGRCVS